MQIHSPGFDSLSLQRLLLTVAGGIGGAWTPARATVEDVTIQCCETQALLDGKWLVIEHRMTATQRDYLGSPHLVISREIRATDRPDAPRVPSPAILQVISATACSFADADAVMTALDIVTAECDAKTRELRAALEVANV